MWGVPKKTACNNSRSISGSCSQVSIIASLICPVFKALNSAGVSMTSPRQVFIITGRRCKEAKNEASAKWKVLYIPVRYKGVWKVIISHLRIKVCKSVKPCSPLSSRGGSFSNTFIPKASAIRRMRLPTWPTPTMPIHVSSGFIPRRRLSSRSAACTYCSTPPALHPGQLLHAIPASRQ